jgi:hypothetical protein
MVITDFYLVRVSIEPNEADSPPVIDPNTMLTFPVALQSLKPVTGKNLQIQQGLRRVQVSQFSQRYGLNVRRHLRMLPAKKLFGLLVPEGSDHENSV